MSTYFHQEIFHIKSSAVINISPNFFIEKVIKLKETQKKADF